MICSQLRNDSIPQRKTRAETQAKILVFPVGYSIQIHDHPHRRLLREKMMLGLPEAPELVPVRKNRYAVSRISKSTSMRKEPVGEKFKTLQQGCATTLCATWPIIELLSPLAGIKISVDLLKEFFSSRFSHSSLVNAVIITKESEYVLTYSCSRPCSLLFTCSSRIRRCTSAR